MVLYTSTRHSGHGRRGAVLIITLVAVTLLVGLLFFVFNLGDQINRRVQQQNTSDAVAMGGATWMARTMNLVAMGNVTTSRLIGLVAILDAMPVAAEMTVAEETGTRSLPEALAPWKTVGSAFTPYEEDNFFRRGLAELYEQLTPSEDDSNDYELLKMIDIAYDQADEWNAEGGYDVATTTEWHAPGGRGSLWQAMEAIDGLSAAALLRCPQLAQSNAIRIGEANGASVSFLVPLLPAIPAERTHFDDYGVVLLDSITVGTNRNSGANMNRVNESKLVSRLANSKDTANEARSVGSISGGAIPDVHFEHRLGPFARLFRWRHYSDQWSGGYDSKHIERWGYTTYGPLHRSLDQLTSGFGQAGGHAGTVDTSRFVFHLRTLAQVKLAYLMGLESPILVQYSDEWISDLEEAKKFAEQDRADVESGKKELTDVMTTRHYRVGVKSTTGWDTSDWMNLAKWDPRPPTMTFVPNRWHSGQLSGKGPYTDPKQQPLSSWISDQRGWREIRNPEPYEAGRNYGSMELNRWYEVEPGGRVWARKSMNTRVQHDGALGLPDRIICDSKGEPILDSNGEFQYEYYTVYYFEIRCFGGVEVRNTIELSNPIEGADLDDLPKPILLDTSEAEYEPIHDHGGRRKWFNVLGVSRQSAHGRIWSQQFRSGSPLGDTMAVSQASVFNTHSWGLWTQSWQSKLVPVTKWDQWRTTLDSQIGDIYDEASEKLDPEQVIQTQQYLEALEPDLMDLFSCE